MSAENFDYHVLDQLIRQEWAKIILDKNNLKIHEDLANEKSSTESSSKELKIEITDCHKYDDKLKDKTERCGFKNYNEYPLNSYGTKPPCFKNLTTDCENSASSEDSDKENINDKIKDNENSIQDFINEYKKQDKIMVKIGEFSPLNPAFRSPSRPLLGLGEYEESRKIFLQKKRREYQQYLQNALERANRAKENNKRQDELRKNEENLKKSLRKPSVTSSSSGEIGAESVNERLFSPDTPERKVCLIKCLQDSYRRELDKQMEEKRILKEKEDENEKKELKRLQRRARARRENAMKYFNEKRGSELQSNSMMVDESYQNRKTTSNNALEEKLIHNRDAPVETKKEYLPSCSYDDTIVLGKKSSSPPVNVRHHSYSDEHLPDEYGSYQKLQQELYRLQLSKQIEEKRQFEKEMKKREEEEDQKIAKIAESNAIKIKQEYDKSQEEHLRQQLNVLKQEEALRDNLRMMQRETAQRRNEKKLLKRQPLINNSILNSTQHEITNKPKFNSEPKFHKNISMQKPVHAHDEEQNTPENVHISRKNKEVPLGVSINKPDVTKGIPDSSIIIEAPYKMAVEGKKDEEIRPSSPVIPAVRTKSLLNTRKFESSESEPVPHSSRMPQYRGSLLSNLTEIRQSLMKAQKNLKL